MTTRDEMTSALKRIVVPDLRRRGFTGSFPHFRRIGETRIDLLTFQFDKWGGGFVAELSKCGLEGVTLPWGEKIPPRKVTARDLHPEDRFRLGSGGPGADHWYRFDGGEPAELAAREVLNDMDAAENWWAG